MGNNNFFVNEVLCFTKKKHGCIPHFQLETILACFYDEQELINAKELLFQIAKPVIMGDKGFWMIKRQGSGLAKKKADVEDMLSLYNHLDRKKFSFPKFFAEDPDRLPKVKADKVDILHLATSVSDRNMVIQNLVKTENDLKRTPCTTTSQSIAPSHLDPRNTSVMKVNPVSGSKDESNTNQEGNAWQEVYSRKQTRSSTVRVDAVHVNDANQSNQKQTNSDGIKTSFMEIKHLIKLDCLELHNLNAYGGFKWAISNTL